MTEPVLHADALWYVADGRVEIRPSPLPILGDGDVRIAARFSGISRGTERLVSHGRVPSSEYLRMRCPHQSGDFPFPVKYGYALVGVIEDGPADRIGQNVFVLHPHQQQAVVAAQDAHALPTDVPPRRAVLAANTETALNVVWDAGVGPGDRVVIIGGGVLGLLIAYIVSGIPGTETTVVDIDPSRADITKTLGASFSLPANAPSNQDVAIHTSSTEAGLHLALSNVGNEARIVDASWYGDKKVTVSLGEAFHARRLQIISSQVGAVPAERRARWTFARRMATALQLLRDDRLDALITHDVYFTDAPRQIPKALAEASPGLMTVLRYPSP
jgi:NADPH:quinone reductase-like Zn-dependent oxidoreductase